MTERLQGKVALVTGAARGQGRSHAVRLASEGADIIAVDICADIASVRGYSLSTPTDLAKTTELVESLDRRIVSVQADVRDRGVLIRAVADAVATLGRLDIVVANAGIAVVGADSGFDAFIDTISVNLVGVINTVDATYPHLGPGASIIATGSVGGLMPGGTDSAAAGAGGSGYSHSKRAVARLVHDLAFQLAPQSIRVNAVHPTNVETPMLLNDAMFQMFRPDLAAPTREDAEFGFRAMQRMPIGYVQPEDISNAVAFLASDEARYITGLQMKVDAGSLLATTTSGAPS
jgi:SDR family mycofactocin-dependent oxidoreductase